MQKLIQTLVSIGLGAWIIGCVAGALILVMSMGIAERLIGGHQRLTVAR